MLRFEHDFRHNADVLRVALKSMILKCFKHNALPSSKMEH